MTTYKTVERRVIKIMRLVVANREAARFTPSEKARERLLAEAAALEEKARLYAERAAERAISR